MCVSAVLDFSASFLLIARHEATVLWATKAKTHIMKR